MKRLLILSLLLPLVACSPIENNARDAAAALKGSLVAAQAEYASQCQADAKATVCDLITRATAAQNALITATEAYCGWSVTLPPADPTAKCVPVKTAEAGLNVAIANANNFVVALKGVIK